MPAWATFEMQGAHSVPIDQNLDFDRGLDVLIRGTRQEPQDHASDLDDVESEDRVSPLAHHETPLPLPVPTVPGPARNKVTPSPGRSQIDAASLRPPIGHGQPIRQVVGDRPGRGCLPAAGQQSQNQQIQDPSMHCRLAHLSSGA